MTKKYRRFLRVVRRIIIYEYNAIAYLFNRRFLLGIADRHKGKICHTFFKMKNPSAIRKHSGASPEIILIHKQTAQVITFSIENLEKNKAFGLGFNCLTNSSLKRDDIKYFFIEQISTPIEFGGKINITTSHGENVCRTFSREYQ